MRLTNRRVADQDARTRVRLRAAVLGDGLAHLVLRGGFGAGPLGGADGTHRLAPEVVADEILDEDRQQFRLVERGVRLPERIVDRRPYLPLHLEPMKAAGWCRRRLVVQRREEL